MVKANQKQRGVRPSQKRPHWYSWTTVFVFSANASHFIPKEINNCLPFFILVSLKRKPQHWNTLSVRKKRVLLPNVTELLVDLIDVIKDHDEGIDSSLADL